MHRYRPRAGDLDWFCTLSRFVSIEKKSCHATKRFPNFPRIAVPTCPVPIVENGEASSKSPSKAMEAVEITCKNGYKLVGDASANCVPSAPGKVEWDQIPTCEGRSAGLWTASARAGLVKCSFLAM